MKKDKKDKKRWLLGLCGGGILCVIVLLRYGSFEYLTWKYGSELYSATDDGRKNGCLIGNITKWKVLYVSKNQAKVFIRDESPGGWNDSILLLEKTPEEEVWSIPKKDGVCMINPLNSSYGSSDTIYWYSWPGLIR